MKIKQENLIKEYYQYIFMLKNIDKLPISFVVEKERKYTTNRLMMHFSYVFPHQKITNNTKSHRSWSKWMLPVKSPNYSLNDIQYRLVCKYLKKENRKEEYEI